MSIDLSTLVRPRSTAVVTQECQGAVVGPGAALRELADEAAREALPSITRLLPAARAAGVTVVHCVMQQRPDRRGSNTNARLFAGAAQLGMDLSPGSPGGSVVPELGPEPEDLVLTRTHGLGPMSGTDLDPILRNLGITTIVVTGVSVNVAILNLVMDAGEPRATRSSCHAIAVAGVPADYATAVIDGTLSLLSTLTTTDTLIETWRRAPKEATS